MFSGMEYVYEVYKERSFSKAARNLFISQPSLSATIKRIEAKVGAPLFDRSSIPILLTDCGQKYIETVEKLQYIQNSFQQYMDDVQNLCAGSLRLGGSNLFSSYVLPPLIAAYKSRFPKIDVCLVEESTSRLEQLLAGGELDFIIDNYSFGEQIFDRRLYHREHLILAVPKHTEVNRKLAGYQLSVDCIVSGEYLKKDVEPVPLEAFRDEPFIFLKSENDTSQRGMRLCQKSGFRPNILFDLDQQMTAYNLTCSGMGVSFISDTLVACVQPHPQVVYYKLGGEDAGRNVYFYSKKDAYVTKAMREFLNIVEEMPMVPQPGR